MAHRRPHSAFRSGGCSASGDSHATFGWPRHLPDHSYQHHAPGTPASLIPKGPNSVFVGTACKDSNGTARAGQMLGLWVFAIHDSSFTLWTVGQPLPYPDLARLFADWPPLLSRFRTFVQQSCRRCDHGSAEPQPDTSKIWSIPADDRHSRYCSVSRRYADDNCSGSGHVPVPQSCRHGLPNQRRFCRRHSVAADNQ